MFQNKKSVLITLLQYSKKRISNFYLNVLVAVVSLAVGSVEDVLRLKIMHKKTHIKQIV